MAEISTKGHKTGENEDEVNPTHPVSKASDNGGPWQTVRKRKRRSTGGTSVNNDATTTSDQSIKANISKDMFKKMSIDEKLVTLFDLMSNVNNIDGRVHKVEQHVSDLRCEQNEHKRRLLLLEYKSIDSEARARRNNLIFRGVPEVLINENCDEIIKTFLRDELKIDPTNICIQRAHRIGNPFARNVGQAAPSNYRPIIVCFRDFKDTEMILANAYRLKNNPAYGINRDYPKEIVSARSRLWADYKKAKSDNTKGSVFIGFPAKLIVNKRVVRDEFPQWNQILKMSRMQDTETVVHKPLETISEHDTPSDKTTPEAEVLDTSFLSADLHTDSEEDISEEESEHEPDEYSKAMLDMEARLSQSAKPRKAEATVKKPTPAKTQPKNKILSRNSRGPPPKPKAKT